MRLADLEEVYGEYEERILVKEGGSHHEPTLQSVDGRG